MVVEGGLLLLLTVIAMGSSSAFGQSSIPDPDAWVTNGDVHAIAHSGGITYLGGDFSHIGPLTWSWVPLDITSGQLSGSYPKVVGSANASVADGLGGWYIGGSFKQVGAVACSGLAHMLSDGSMDAAWTPPMDGYIYSLAISGATIYVGGHFTSIDGQPRNSIASFNTVTGKLTAWNPDANGVVYRIAVSGATIYVSGYFSSIGGQARNHIAALDGTTGKATAWDPNANGNVTALAVSGTTVYAGGSFNTIGGKLRASIAALDTAVNTGNATAWNPNAYNNGLTPAIRDIVVSGATVYAGGYFTGIGGQMRNGLAALDTTMNTNNATGWNPGFASADVYTLAVSASTVYAGGAFEWVNAPAGLKQRHNLAAFDRITGNVTSWDPYAEGEVTTLGISGTKIYAGGNLATVGGYARNKIAALDAAGVGTAWNPNADGIVDALAVSGSAVYAGGRFQNIGGQSRNYIAALNATSNTNNATAWNPDLQHATHDGNIGVRALAVSGATVYVAGVFTSIGGQPRNGLAALSATVNTNNATAWNPSADGVVYSIAVSGTTVYAGGDFTSIGGQPRNGLAALNATVNTNNATAWNPGALGTSVYSIAVSGTMVYVGGGFTSIGGQQRKYLAALDATVNTNNATAWNPGADNAVRTLAVLGTNVYAGGDFTTIGGQTRYGAAALDTTANTNNATSWNPNGYANGFAFSQNAVHVGGGRNYTYTPIGTLSVGHYAQFLLIPEPPRDPGADNIGPTSIRWTWSDHSFNETGFKVWVDSGAAEPITLRTTTAADATNWTMGSLQPNTQYTFQVAATNAQGDSAKTNSFSTRTPAAVPVAPAVGNATASTLDVSVGIGDGNPENTEYALQCVTTGQWIQPGGVLGSAPAWNTAAGWGAASLLDLAPATTYAFAAKARDSVGVETVPGPSGQATTLQVSSVTATISRVTPSPTTADAVIYKVVFSKPVGTSFTAADVKVGGTLSGTTTVAGADPSYTVTLSLADPNANGTVAIVIPAGSVTDLLGNPYSGGNSQLCMVYNWPGFAVQPQSARLYVADSLTLRVQVAAEGGIPTAYRWKFDDGSTVDDGPSLVEWPLGAVAAAHAGHYWCEVTFDGVVHFSNRANIEVQPRVGIITPPVGGDGTPGGSHTFAVTASGGYGPLTYQWKKDGADIYQGNGNILQLSGLNHDDSGGYSVEVSDTNGDSIETVPVTLTVPMGLPVAGMGGLALLAAILGVAAVRRRS